MNRSRKANLEALVELLRTKSYSKITASDIIGRSGYGRTGFYRQFSDKNALAAALVKEHTAMYARILANDLRDSQCNMEDMVRHILEHVMQHRAEYHAILSSQIPGHGFDEFCACALVDFRIMANARPNCSDAELDYDLFYYATTRQFADYLRYWDAHGYEPAAPQMAKCIAGVIDHLSPGDALRFENSDGAESRGDVGLISLAELS